MTERWWQITGSGPLHSVRPTGSATTVFTTFALSSLTPETWPYHDLRLGKAPGWLGDWNVLRGTLHTLAQAEPSLARIVYDPLRSEVWLSLRTASADPRQILLEPHMDQWPDYTRKWWQREAYQRQAPSVDAAGTRHERLLVDRSTRRVWETDTANILADIDGQLVTPDPVDAPLLWGTTLQYLAQTRSIVRHKLTLPQLRAATQIWVCNAALGMQRALLAE